MNKVTQLKPQVNLGELATIVTVTLHLSVSQASYGKGKTTDKTMMIRWNEELWDMKILRLIGMSYYDVVYRGEF